MHYARFTDHGAAPSNACTRKSIMTRTFAGGAGQEAPIFVFHMLMREKRLVDLPRHGIPAHQDECQSSLFRRPVVMPAVRYAADPQARYAAAARP